MVSETISTSNSTPNLNEITTTNTKTSSSMTTTKIETEAFTTKPLISKYKTTMDSSNFFKENHWYHPNKNASKILETYKPPNKYDRVPAMSKGSRRLLGYSFHSMLPERRNFDLTRAVLKPQPFQQLNQSKNDMPLFSKHTNKFYLDDDDDEDDEYVMVYDSSKANFIPSSSSSSSTTAHHQKTSAAGSSKVDSPASFSDHENNSNNSQEITTASTTSNNYQDSGEGGFNEKDRIRVVVRIRPINQIEKSNGDNEIISCDRTSLIVEGKTQSRKFSFDAVFDPNTVQDEVFNYSGIKRLINMAIDGYICTCFAYGQTGSGKTYTMCGPSGTYNLTSQDKYTHYGLIPRSINYLFNQLRQRTQETQSVFYIRVSYFEIYNEQIRDLINPISGRKLEIRGSQEEGFYVDNLFATYIETMDEILTILQEGELNRATASHLLNEHSSRSHAILTIQVENELQNSQDPKEQITKLGKLIFVDLAGSEKVKVTHSKGKQLVETNNINKSLLVLGTCISALSDQGKKDAHIPYRDSKLTKLLSESLGGTGITLMIACVSPSTTCENETLNTLRYANRAQNIENIPIMKSDSRENIVQKLKRELRKLKEENLTLKQQLGYPNMNSGRLPKINTIRNGSSNSNASSESDLYGMLQEYIQENKTLKSENSQLEKFREKIRKQHEILTRENEKLARKLEQVLRSQGHQPSNVITQHPTEYIILEDTPPSPSVDTSKSLNKTLPRIEKTPGEANSVRSTSPTRASPKKFFINGNSPSGEPGEGDSIEQIEIIKPSYSRKFKQIKDFKTKYVSDPTLNTNQAAAAPPPPQQKKSNNSKLPDSFAGETKAK